MKSRNEVMNYQDIMTKLEPIVRYSGAIIMSYVEDEKNIQYKDLVNLVTRADHESEQYLFDKISEVFPDDAILAEEGHQKEGVSGFTWVIDPLDGTTSYAHGFPFFCISVGLIDIQKNSILGMVFAPLLKELFTAFNGGGAYLNGRRIQTSAVSTLEKALVGTGFPYNRRSIMDRLMKRLANFLHHVHDVRRTGSAALDISYVAAGRLDAYFEEGLQPWDVAAAAVVLQEAGGKLTKFNGDSFDIFFPETAASNGKIHHELVEVLGRK